MKQILLTIAMITMSLSLAACTNNSSNDGDAKEEETKTVPQWLGGLSPENALEYMKNTPELVIIDVREPKWIDRYFTGSMRIPWTEMERRYSEVPSDKPILLNCGAGVVAPRAYKILQEKRKDLKSLCYIAGTPLFSEYNEWLKSNKEK